MVLSERDQPPENGDEVRVALTAILDSPDFHGSARDRKFLKYIVEETLGRRADRLKAFTIATEVFGRNASFDAESDPIVRATAGRVRRALERYYLITKPKRGIFIEIPKGGYAPTFTKLTRDAGATPSLFLAHRRFSRVSVLSSLGLLSLILIAIMSSPALDWRDPPPSGVAQAIRGRPGVVVTFSTVDIGDPRSTSAARIITDQIIARLAKFQEIQVIRPEIPVKTEAVAGSLPQDATYSYVLEGGVLLTATHVKIMARLVDARNGAVAWAQIYDQTAKVGAEFDAQSTIATEIATEVGQPYGAVYIAEQSRVADIVLGSSCTGQYFRYRASRSTTQHRTLRDCLEDAVKRAPTNSTAWAILALLFVDEDRFAYNRKPRPLDRAKQAAQNALRLDPTNTRALEGLMIAYGVSGDVTEGLTLGEKALALNPNDTELAGEVGARRCAAGQVESGAALVLAARQLNPAHAAFYNGTLAYCNYLARNYSEAVDFLRGSSAEQHHFYHLLLAVSLAQLGRLEEARQHGDDFKRQRPDFVANFDAQMKNRLLREVDRARMRDGAEKAGILLPESQGGGNPPGTESISGPGRPEIIP